MLISRVCLTAILATLTCLPLLRDTAAADTAYRMPPKAIADVLNAPPPVFTTTIDVLNRSGAEMVDWLDRWVKNAPPR